MIPNVDNESSILPLFTTISLEKRTTPTPTFHLRADRNPVHPQTLPYVCMLIVILFFIYAIIGMQVGRVWNGFCRGIKLWLG